MNYEIGLVSAAEMYTPLDESVTKIADAGFRLVELSAEQFEDYVELEKDAIDRLNAIKKERDLIYTVHGPLTGLNMDSPLVSLRRKAVNRLKKYIDMAADVGSEILVLHPVPLTPQRVSFYSIKKIKEKKRIVPVIQKFLPQIERAVRDRMLQKYEVGHVVKSVLEAYENAEARKVSISCENLHIGFSKPEEFEFVFKEDRPYLNFTYDPAHAFLSGQSNYDWVNFFSSKLNHLHAVDTDGKVDGHPVVGTGKVAWPIILKKLQFVGYKGNLVLENRNVENGIKSKSYLESLMR